MIVAMSSAPEPTSPYSGLIATWSNLVILVVAAVAGAIVGLLLLLILGAPYSSDSLVNGGPGDTPSKPLDLSGDQLDRYVDTELIYIGTLTDAMNEAISQATGNPDPTPATAVQDGSTNVIKISAVADDAEEAARASKAAADVYVANWKTRNKSTESAASRFVQEPNAADAQPTIKKSTGALLGFVLGAVVGVVIIWVRVVRERRARDERPQGISP